MTVAHIDPNHLSEGRWTVEFSEYGSRTEAQRQLLDTTNPQILHGILEIWLKVVAPDARLVEPEGSLTKTIKFCRRSDQRRFQRIWGGRIVATAPPTATPSARQG
jgi:hypothetical protein